VKKDTAIKISLDVFTAVFFVRKVVKSNFAKKARTLKMEYQLFSKT